MYGCASNEKQKIFGLGECVGEEYANFVNSMITELSGALLWLGGNSFFAAIYDLMKKCGTVLPKKLKDAMKKMSKNVKELITGVLVVATVLVF